MSDRHFGENTTAWFRDESNAASVKSLPLPTAFAEWLELATECGVFVVDPMGTPTLTPAARPLLAGLNAVLAGGQVEVKIVRPGKPEAQDLLNGKLSKVR